MPKDCVCADTPLREVIVEVYWRFTSKDGVSDAPLKPTFAEFDFFWGEAVANCGFSYIEELVKLDNPSSFFDRTIIKRYRTGPNLWPLLQIGPNILTINAIAPYCGWDFFRHATETAIVTLCALYPYKSAQIKVNSINLRYIHLFTASDNARDVAFDPYQAKNCRAGCMAYHLQAPANAEGAIIWHRATDGAQMGVILELQVRTCFQQTQITPGDIFFTLDEARKAIEGWSETLISDKILNKSGGRTLINRHAL